MTPGITFLRPNYFRQGPVLRRLFSTSKFPTWASITLCSYFPPSIKTARDMNGNSVTANGLNTAKSQKPILWTHPDPDSSRMAGFMHRVNAKYNLKLRTYPELYKWSIDNIGLFWGEVWDSTGIVAEWGFDEVREDIFLSCNILPLIESGDVGGLMKIGDTEKCSPFSKARFLCWFALEFRRKSTVSCKCRP